MQQAGSRVFSARRLATVVALVLVAFALAVPANAITSTSGAVQLVSAGAPDVLRATGTPQPAGNLTLKASDNSALHVINGERIIIEVADGLGQNCNSTGKFVGFRSLPTVTALNSNATFSAELAPSTTTNALRNDGTQCTAFTPATNDRLILTVVNAPGPGGTLSSITISNISYDVGSLAAVGDVVVRWASDVPPLNDAAIPAGTGDTGVTAGATNAFITNLRVTSDRSGPISVGANRPFGDLTLEETNFASTTPAATGNGVCVNLLAPFRMTFTDAGAVALSQGSDAPGVPAILDSGHTIRFAVVSSAPETISTFEWTGIRVNADQVGDQAVDVTQCSAGAAPLPVTPAAESNPTVTRYTDAIGTVLASNPVARRYPGDNRNDTAALIGTAAFDCTGADPTFAIVARNDDFADALAANYVAGQLGAPILLVRSHGAIPDETIAALHDVGVTDVIVFGGPSAVGDDVVAALAALPSFTCAGAQRPATLVVTRVQGSNRFATARAAASFLAAGHAIGTLDADPNDNVGTVRTAILANGRNFPDAMVAGPMAYQGSTCARSTVGTNCEGLPLLETDGQAAALPSETDGFLTDQSIAQVLVIGGPDAVPSAITDALTAKGIKVVRLQGLSRQATAVDVATFAYQRLQFGVVDNGGPIDPIGSVALARGDFFTDALALGPLAGSFGEPILLTVDPFQVGSTTDNFLAVIAQPFNGADGGATGGLGFSVTTIDIAGSTGAISTAAQNEALAALA